MNNKTLLVVLIICGLILSGLALRDGELLILAVPFMVYLIFGILQSPSEIDLTAARRIDRPSIAAEKTAQTRIEITNRGKPFVNLALEDPVSESITIQDGQTKQRLALPAGGSTELKYEFGGKRGVYSWNTIRARASDPFGLFELESDIPASGDIRVFPTPLQIRQVTPKPRHTLHAAGPIPARQAGAGIDFWGIREYRPGDSLRRLNWRLAARRSRKLFTNEYEREEIADYGLILDARKFSGTDTLEEELFEYSISAAAALSENYLKAGNRLSLLIFGDSIVSVYPGYGKHQLNKVQSTLARARLGANFPFSYLEYLPTRLFPARSSIVIFSTVNPRDLDIYARLLSFGYEVLLISPDPVDYASRMLPQTQTNSLAVRAARVERNIQLKKLLKMGVQVIDWPVNQPLETIIRKTTLKMGHRRNFQVKA
jgi:uncharacterized protein (DUF58 family)